MAVPLQPRRGSPDQTRPQGDVGCTRIDVTALRVRAGDERRGDLHASAQDPGRRDGRDAGRRVRRSGRAHCRQGLARRTRGHGCLWVRCLADRHSARRSHRVNDDRVGSIDPRAGVARGREAARRHRPGEGRSPRNDRIASSSMKSRFGLVRGSEAAVISYTGRIAARPE